MDAQLFNQQVGSLASSLGDATRRGIYISVREAPEAVTAAQIAELFEIHTNVARHHLDKLVADGYLQVTHRRRSGFFACAARSMHVCRSGARMRLVYSVHV